MKKVRMTVLLLPTGGVPYKIEDKAVWVLSDFVESLKQPPSKLRLYILYWPTELRVSLLPVCIGG